MVTLNSPQLLSKKYMPWRILRAPGKWASVYIERARTLRGYKSALVFPEQLIPVLGSSVYSVDYSTNNSNETPNRQTSLVEVKIHKFSEVQLILSGEKGQPTVEDVFRYEDEHDTEPGHIRVAGGGWMASFFNSALFTAKRDAVTYAKKRLTLISD
jgi:hypothetical protein